jgi:hypothetical protein
LDTVTGWEMPLLGEETSSERMEGAVLPASSTTRHTAEVHGRPPDPLEPVASTIRSVQELMMDGSWKRTTGGVGWAGAAAVTVADLAYGFKAHRRTAAVQKSLRAWGSRETF